MEFVHQAYIPGETVAAIATAPGEGGVAIVRISGEGALEVANAVFSGNVFSYQSHTAHFGALRDIAGKHVDDVLLLPMLGTRSYTGEDTVEIHCHGGALMTRRVLDCVLAAGARAAKPGEFTFKAFINGKLDLAQAEAVQALIHARNEKALDAADEQLQGTLSEKILGFQQNLNELAAILEAWVDFPDEGLEFMSMEALIEALEGSCAQIMELIATYHDGRIIQEGIALCLVGCPNVGKSSLMNALLQRERAIVSPIAGTTRDVLEDDLRLNGLNFRLIDTAGLRSSLELIEQEGIRRTKEQMAKADLVLLVLDASCGLTDADQELLDEALEKKTIVVWNKIDLPHESLPQLSLPHVAALSAKEKKGLDQLKGMIDTVLWENGPPSKEEIFITNARHFEALQKAADALKAVVSGLRAGVSPEFVSSDMRHSLKSLGSIIGSDITEDIITAIFSQFCIGK